MQTTTHYGNDNVYHPAPLLSRPLATILFVYGFLLLTKKRARLKGIWQGEGRAGFGVFIPIVRSLLRLSYYIICRDCPTLQIEGEINQICNSIPYTTVFFFI